MGKQLENCGTVYRRKNLAAGTAVCFIWIDLLGGTLLFDTWRCRFPVSCICGAGTAVCGAKHICCDARFTCRCVLSAACIASPTVCFFIFRTHLAVYRFGRVTCFFILHNAIAAFLSCMRLNLFAFFVSVVGRFVGRCKTFAETLKKSGHKQKAIEQQRFIGRRRRTRNKSPSWGSFYAATGGRFL